MKVKSIREEIMDNGNNYSQIIQFNNDIIVENIGKNVDIDDIDVIIDILKNKKIKEGLILFNHLKFIG